MGAGPAKRKGDIIGSDQWYREQQPEAEKQIELSKLFAAPAVAETKAKVAGMHGMAFSQKTGPLGILTKAKVKRQTLLGGAVI